MHTWQVPKQTTLKRSKAGSLKSAAEEGTSTKKLAASKQGPDDNGDDSNDQDEGNAEEVDEEPEERSMCAILPHAFHACTRTCMCHHEIYATTPFWGFGTTMQDQLKHCAWESC